MARTKKTTTVEEEIDYKEDIHDISISEIAHEEPKEEEIVEEKQPEETPEPKVDIEAITKAAADEASKKTRDEIADLLKGDTKDDTERNVNEYQKLVADAAKEGRQVTWDEVIPLIEDNAIKKLEDKLQTAYETDQKRQSEARQAEESNIAVINQRISNEITELYNSNKLTRIKNNDDPNDQGKREIESLYQTMVDVNTKRETEYQEKVRDIYASENRVATREELGLEPIASVTRIQSNYWKRPNQQPPGFDAPILESNAGAAPASDDENYSYKEVHNTGWRGLFRR